MRNWQRLDATFWSISLPIDGTELPERLTSTFVFVDFRNGKGDTIPGQPIES